jgi:hypothetical protein
LQSGSLQPVNLYDDTVLYRDRDLSEPQALQCFLDSSQGVVQLPFLPVASGQPVAEHALSGRASGSRRGMFARHGGLSSQM